MAATRQWTEVKPASGDKIKDGPAEFQNYWRDIRERANIGGHVWDGVSALDKQGLHAVNASGVASPDIYKSDMGTKIVAWGDATTAILADHPFTGGKNFPAAMLMDEAIEADSIGYKRGLQGLRIFESAPVDTKVNIRRGSFFQTAAGARRVVLYAGGFLTVGAGALVLPAAGNKANYCIVLDQSGTLTARKGLEVAVAGVATDPNATVGDTILGYVTIRFDSVNFSFAASGANAFLSHEGRVDAMCAFNP